MSWARVQERLAELETALEDAGWTRLAADGSSAVELSRKAIRTICYLARLYFLKNPLIRRAVSIKASYVFSQGVRISSPDAQVNDVIQAFLNDPQNRKVISSAQAHIQLETALEIEGNIFFALFVDPSTGRVIVRTLPVDEVEDIVTNPDDVCSPWFYKRVYAKRSFDITTGKMDVKQVVEFYPSLEYVLEHDDNEVRSIGEQVVHWDTPVYHVAVNRLPGARFGIPEVYAALDWARSYREFLEDWATYVRALSRFAWIATSKSGPAGVAAVKRKLQTTLSLDNPETNPAPAAGSIWASANGASLEPISIRNAAIDADDGRSLKLMVASATGFPETFFGDVSVGTLATATSLDRPTELMISERQQLWQELFKTLLSFVVFWAAKSPGGPLPKGLADSALRGGAGVRIDVDFPSVLARDKLREVQAIVTAATLDGKEPAGVIDQQTLSRLLFTALGEDDIDDLLKRLNLERDKGKQALTELCRKVREQGVDEGVIDLLAGDVRFTAADYREAARLWKQITTAEWRDLLDADVDVSQVGVPDV